jgi:hypothetical protein
MVFIAEEISYVKGEGFVFNGHFWENTPENYRGEVTVCGEGRGDVFKIKLMEVKDGVKKDGMISANQKVRIMVTW